MSVPRLKPETLAAMKDRVRGLPLIHPDDVEESPEGSEIRALHVWIVEEQVRRRRLWLAEQEDPDRERILEEAKRRWPWAWSLG